MGNEPANSHKSNRETRREQWGAEVLSWGGVLFIIDEKIEIQSPIILLQSKRSIIRLKLLLLLSRVSRVRLCATPQTAAHQAPPSLGFSRQEHWSGLPFPSPMHESEKSKWSRLKQMKLIILGVSYCYNGNFLCFNLLKPKLPIATNCWRPSLPQLNHSPQ